MKSKKAAFFKDPTDESERRMTSDGVDEQRDTFVVLRILALQYNIMELQHVEISSFVLPLLTITFE